MQGIGDENSCIVVMRQGAIAYGAREILWIDEFCVHRGEIVLVVGGNGTGKTSLFRTLAGIGPRFTGDMRYLGQPLAPVAAHTRARNGIRLVPQERQVFDRLSARQCFELAVDNLVVRGRGAMPETPGYIQTALSGRNKFVSQFSGGEAKRLLLESLVVGQVQVLMLDEVFAGMDAAAVDRVMVIVRNCISRRAGCVLADHTGTAREAFGAVTEYRLLPHEEGPAAFKLVRARQ